MRTNLCLATLVLVASAWESRSAKCAFIFTLRPELETRALTPAEGVVRWVPKGGRFGGPALEIVPDQTTTKARFLLFKKPRPLPGPNQCRAEAWVKEGKGECRVHLVLYDAAAGSEGRRYPLAVHKAVQPPHHDDGHAPWSYAAVDFALEADQELARFNIEVSATGERILLDGLKVLGADSILANGDFWEIEHGLTEPPAASLPGPLLRIPRGWRRHYAGRTGAQEAEGVFGVEESAAGRVLVVQKSEGRFALSAEPIATPDEAGRWVARAYAAGASATLPTVTLRQYGPRGLLREDRSDRVLQWEGLAVVSTGRLERDPGTERLLFGLHFPKPAGTYRVQRVEVPLLATDRDLEIFVDQVGYDSGDPLRFIVATQRFPTAGAGGFRLDNAVGPSYQGPLVPLGRAVGQHEADWGSYYFEGSVIDPAPGRYVLRATLGDRSVSVDNVRVGSQLRLRETGPLAYRFYFVQRCGHAVPGWHGPCHMDDARLPDGSHVDVTGGYHNAGDFHKHLGDNTPVSVYGMILAYRRFEDFFSVIDTDGNGRADLLDEAIWGADWLLKMVDPQTGRMWMNVTNDIDYFGIPEFDTDGMPGTGDDRLINTANPADLGAFTIAAWAVLSRYVPEAEYLTAAEKLWSKYEERILTGHNPRHVIAALELYQTTRHEHYRSAAERLAENLLVLQNRAGWFAVSPGGGPGLRIVDEGTTPAALAFYALAQPDAANVDQIRVSLRKYFAWSFRMADNPFGIIRHDAGGTPFFFKSRDAWFGGQNSAYCSTAWAAYLAARVFADDPTFARRLRAHAANQVHWILGMNPLNLCMFEGRGNSARIKYHHLYAEIPGHSRGAVPGAIPNGIIRAPGNADRPWFDLRSGAGSLPGPESAEPWLPHNAYYLLMLSANR